jgi:hypothetical protein
MLGVEEPDVQQDAAGTGKPEQSGAAADTTEDAESTAGQEKPV